MSLIARKGFALGKAQFTSTAAGDTLVAGVKNAFKGSRHFP